MKNLHCLENIFVTIATWLNRDFNPIFAFSWSFVLLPPVDDMNIFGYRIALGRMGSWRVLEQDDLFEKYCGVGLHWEVKGSPTELFRLINSELCQGRPVCLSIDSYFCTWHPMYNKANITHYCLVIGLEENGKGLLCIDPMFSSGVELLEYTKLEQSPIETGVLNISQIEALYIDWFSLLEDSVKKVKAKRPLNNDFDDMRELARFILNLDTMKKEIDGFYNANAAPFIRRLYHVKCARNNYSLFFKYVAEKFNIEKLVLLSKEIEECGIKWSKICNLLIKTCFIMDHALCSCR